MNMKFYMTPGSCSTGIHILLEELELCFEVYLVNLINKENLQAEYLKINPKGTIPTLVTDTGKVLSDFQSIAWWLAVSYPRTKLLTGTVDDQAEILGIMNFAVNTLHAEGFARIFTTEKFTPNQNDFARVKQRGKEIIEQGFKIMNDYLDNEGNISSSFSIADAALFYVEFWADKTAIELPENCQKHYHKMLQRPAVRQVLSEEGYGSMFN